MKTFEFSVIASGLDPHAEDFEARFYENGCDDALVSFQKGHTIVDFAREAESLDEAIASALENVAGTGARIDRLEPDPLVSLAEIAHRARLTRAAVTNYYKGERGENFPPPFARVTSRSPLWHWSTVARWLFKQGTLDATTAIEAAIVEEANRSLEQGQHRIRDLLRQRRMQCQRELRS